MMKTDSVAVPPVPSDGYVLDRALSAYFGRRTAADSDATPCQPNRGLCTVEVANGKRYAVLRNINGILRVYRVRNDGQLKRIVRVPKGCEPSAPMLDPDPEPDAEPTPVRQTDLAEQPEPTPVPMAQPADLAEQVADFQSRLKGEQGVRRQQIAKKKQNWSQERMWALEGIAEHHFPKFDTVVIRSDERFLPQFRAMLAALRDAAADLLQRLQ